MTKHDPFTDPEVMFGMVRAHNIEGFITPSVELAEKVINELHRQGHYAAGVFPLLGKFVVTCPSLGIKVENPLDLEN